jgi:hypothetical protein
MSVSPWSPVVVPGQEEDEAAVAEQDAESGRGLHSSTFRLNSIAFCGIWGECRGFLGGVQGVLGGIRVCLRCILCRKRLRLS